MVDPARPRRPSDRPSPSDSAPGSRSRPRVSSATNAGRRARVAAGSSRGPSPRLPRRDGRVAHGPQAPPSRCVPQPRGQWFSTASTRARCRICPSGAACLIAGASLHRDVPCSDRARAAAEPRCGGWATIHPPLAIDLQADPRSGTPSRACSTSGNPQRASFASLGGDPDARRPDAPRPRGRRVSVGGARHRRVRAADAVAAAIASRGPRRRAGWTDHQRAAAWVALPLRRAQATPVRFIGGARGGGGHHARRAAECRWWSQKWQEVGTPRARAPPRHRAPSSLLQERAGRRVAGSLVGGAAGASLCSYFRRDAPAQPGRSPIAFPVAVTAALVLRSSLTAVGTGVLAAALPARRRQQGSTSRGHSQWRLAPALCCSGVRKSLRDGRPVTEVLRSVDLRVETRGSSAALVGPSGSGKERCSTSSACSTGPPAERVAVAGQDTAGLDDAPLTRLRLNARLRLWFHHRCSGPHRGRGRDDAHGRRHYRMKPPTCARAPSRAARAGGPRGEDRRAPRGDVGGQQQRAMAIARALAAGRRWCSPTSRRATSTRRPPTRPSRCCGVQPRTSVAFLIVTHDPRLAAYLRPHDWLVGLRRRPDRAAITVGGRRPLRSALQRG